MRNIFKRKGMDRLNVLKDIDDFLAKTKGKNKIYLPKHCTFRPKNIETYSYGLSYNELVYLLAMASLNPNGYVREKAVVELGKVSHPIALLYLLYRLSDWVDIIRNSAVEALENYKRPSDLDDLIQILPILENLKRTRRVNLESVYQSYITYIFETHRQHIISNFQSYSLRLKFMIAKHISTSIRNKDELRILLTDKDYLIRNLVVKHFRLLEEEDIQLLIHDKSQKVRYNILYALKNDDHFEQIITPFVADESAWIRNLARFSLKESIKDFAHIYKNKIVNQEQVLGSLMGLSEVGAKADALFIAPLLDSPVNKVRITTFISLSRLDKEKALDYAINNIGDSSISLVKNLIIFISQNYDENSLNVLREHFDSSDIKIRKLILYCFHSIGGWEGLAMLVKGTTDSEESIRNLSEEYLFFWKIKATNLYIKPSSKELVGIKNALDNANEFHKKHKYFNTDILDEIEFYLR